MRQGLADGALVIQPREFTWLDRMESVLESLPSRESEFIAAIMAEVDATKFLTAEYGL